MYNHKVTTTAPITLMLVTILNGFGQKSSNGLNNSVPEKKTCMWPAMRKMTISDFSKKKSYWYQHL